MKSAIFAIVLPALAAAVPATVTPPAPQAVVECTGWHALCTNVDDCKIDAVAKIANCDCTNVNERNFVVTASITDPAVKTATQKACTVAKPCATDAAPVCKAIKDGTYTVGGVKSNIVSTLSYRGWCDAWEPVLCPAGQYADCMTAVCTKNPAPQDADRPLTCKCALKTGPYVGPDGECTTDAGQAESTFAAASWDFANNTFALPMPGYEYVKAACADNKSDVQIPAAPAPQ